MGETKRIVDVLWCGNGDPLTVRTDCGCGRNFHGCSRIRIRMGLAHWRTGSNRHTSSHRQVAHIRHPQLQQQPQRHSKPESIN